MTTLTTVDQLLPVAQKIIETHFEEVPKMCGREAGYHVRPIGHGTPGAQAEGRFDGLFGSISLYLDDDNAIILVMRVVPSFAGYKTILLPEDATEDRLLRHAEFGARTMRANIAKRHAERAEHVRNYQDA